MFRCTFVLLLFLKRLQTMLSPTVILNDEFWHVHISRTKTLFLTCKPCPICSGHWVPAWPGPDELPTVSQTILNMLYQVLESSWNITTFDRKTDGTVGTFLRRQTYVPAWLILSEQGFIKTWQQKRWRRRRSWIPHAHHKHFKLASMLCCEIGNVFMQEQLFVP